MRETILLYSVPICLYHEIGISNRRFPSPIIRPYHLFLESEQYAVDQLLFQTGVDVCRPKILDNLEQRKYSKNNIKLFKSYGGSNL